MHQNPNDLVVGEPVYIINKEHPLFLERATIVDKDYTCYRIKLISIGKYNNQILWVPQHWVEPVPQELK
jgi:hypothetical protein